MAGRKLRNRRGLTLLELILSLALSAILLIAVGIAVDIHMRTLEANRTYVEEAQLARAVLRHIADDLHSAVAYSPFDDSGTESLPDGGLEGAMASAAGLDSSSIDGLLGGSGSGGSAGGSSETEETETTSSSITESVELPPIPGLYGNMYELQIDISRLPRVDQYQPMLAAADASPVNIPSDVKTVAYFVADSTSGFIGGVDPLGAPMTGLFRREADRAVTQYAVASGAADMLNLSTEVIAPEVIGIEFLYFDGVGWLPEWDSNVMGGLPVAVQVTLGVQPIGRNDPRATGGFAGVVSTADVAQQTEILYYQLVVHLPTARPAQQVAGELEALGL